MSGNGNANRRCPGQKNGRLFVLTEEPPSKHTRSMGVSPDRRSRPIALFQSFCRSPPVPWRTPPGGGGEQGRTLPGRRKSIKMSTVVIEA